MINNISDKTTDQTGDNLVRISSKNDILNDIVDDDSLSIDLEKYAVASNKSTRTSIDNVLSLPHKLHLEKIDTNDKNDTHSATGTNNNENSSQNKNTSCKEITNSQKIQKKMKVI